MTGRASDADGLAEYVQSLPFIDTHSHLAGGDFGSPVDDRGGKSLPQVLMSDGLRYLAEAQGEATELLGAYRQWSADDAEAQMRVVLPLLDKLRATTAYAVVREGIRELYPFDGDDLHEGNWRGANERMLATYRARGERAWQREVIGRAGVVRMNQMVELPYVVDHWGALPPGERAAQQALLLPSLVLDGYLFSGFAASAAGRVRSQEILDAHPASHAAYLDFCGRALDLFVRNGGRSVKLMTAYHRPLRFEEVPDRDAARLFALGPGNLRFEGLRRLQDNLCWHLLEMANARGLPLIVHTGYASPTALADPEQLVNLMTSPRLKGLKIDLSHSGWPNVGGAMILTRSHLGCYFNLCWTPVLSRALGRRALSEAIDMLPADKILIGTDCGTVEAFLGTVRLIRRLLADVLAEKVAGGQFGAEVARRAAKAILFDNPAAFYGSFPAPPSAPEWSGSTGPEA